MWQKGEFLIASEGGFTEGPCSQAQIPNQRKGEAECVAIKNPFGVNAPPQVRNLDS